MLHFWGVMMLKICVDELKTSTVSYTHLITTAKLAFIIFSQDILTPVLEDLSMQMRFLILACVVQFPALIYLHMQRILLLA